MGGVRWQPQQIEDGEEQMEVQDPTPQKENCSFTKDEITNIVKDTIRETIPNLLGTIILNFSKIILEVLQSKEDKNKLETTRVRILSMFTELFENEDESEKHQEEDTDTEEQGGAASRKQTRNSNAPNSPGRKWNQNKGRKAWKKRH